MNQVETTLTTWETQLKGIDLDKVPQISYSRGKYIEAQRDLSLMEIDIIRKAASKLWVKRSVSGELELGDDLNTFFWSVAEMESAEDFASLTHFDSKSELRSELEWVMLVSRIGNDVQARVEMLEKGACP